MAWTRPTLADLVARVHADLTTRLGISPLRRSVVAIIARVIAGAVQLLHGYVAWVARQIFPDQSDEEMLLRQAAVYGVTRTAATYAQGVTRVTGTVGTSIPAASALARSDGSVYTTDAIATVGGGGYVDVAVTASTAGSAGTLGVGEVLSFSSSIPSIDVDTTVQSSTLDGADQEEVEALRARLLARLAAPPQGGSAADYEAWALEVGGVTRAWVYPLEHGAGTVGVRFVRDAESPIIPSAGEVAAVQAYLDTHAPATAEVTVAAPVSLAVSYNVHVVPDTSATRAAVTAELTDLHTRTSPGTTLLLSAMLTAVGRAEGLTDYTLVSPVANVVPTTGQIPLLGTVTFS